MNINFFFFFFCEKRRDERAARDGSEETIRLAKHEMIMTLYLEIIIRKRVKERARRGKMSMHKYSSDEGKIL